MIQIVWEADWRRVRPATLGAGGLGMMQLAALLRYLDVPTWDAPQTWVYVGVMVSFVVLAALGWRKAGGIV